MVFSKFRASDGFVAVKLVVSVVEGGEHFEEAEASLLCRFGSCNDIRVPRWVKVVLNFFDLECTVAIGIKLIESFVDKSLAKGIQLSAESCQKFVKADLTISTCVENIEKTLSVAATHAWDAIVVEHSLKLA